jgi:hypothetical protein
MEGIDSKKPDEMRVVNLHNMSAAHSAGRVELSCVARSSRSYASTLVATTDASRAALEGRGGERTNKIGGESEEKNEE